ncbi:MULTISPECIES: DUF2218 domain-containing protein [unclassified Actinobaculum]|uniref:DUF2218 domain-containing protein n=1 Tax=unclassified Actinobaculum TaxID=2609299 RepID=UPI000D5275C6|nr:MULTISPECIES: DUF2218 domain-containing protein [unclassified Actinobaculum]AWE43170.1 DUF2218 domain-containing protein [Actinobaculum sp. 313]RTE48270.1 DUF2218 domain-containing protein [Actinobaculum sp. 352]
MKSIATVTTYRAQRYGKQLVSHMARRITTSWDGDSGVLAFPDKPVTVHLQATAEALIMNMEAPAKDVAHFEEVVGIHVARFGAGDSLRVSWQRDDGSAGSSQGPFDPAEVEAFRARMRARGGAGPAI